MVPLELNMSRRQRPCTRVETLIVEWKDGLDRADAEETRKDLVGGEPLEEAAAMVTVTVMGAIVGKVKFMEEIDISQTHIVSKSIINRTLITSMNIINSHISVSTSLQQRETGQPMELKETIKKTRSILSKSTMIMMNQQDSILP